MNIDAGTITWLIGACLILGGLAVVLDRVNFPQKPFRPKRIRTDSRGATRDRTGAHIINETPEADDTEPDTGA